MQERLKAIRTKLNLTQRQFAGLIGVSRDVIASWEIGRVQPSEAVLKLICKECSVSYTWLKTGEGNMVSPCAEAEKLMRILEGDNGFMKSFLYSLVDMPKESWEMLEAFVKALRQGTELR